MDDDEDDDEAIERTGDYEPTGRVRFASNGDEFEIGACVAPRLWAPEHRVIVTRRASTEEEARLVGMSPDEAEAFAAALILAARRARRATDPSGGGGGGKT